MIVGLLVGGLAIFGVSFVVFVKGRGGLSGSHPLLGRIPLVASLVRPEQAPEAQPAEKAAKAVVEGTAGREVPFLRFGPEAKLERLVKELDAKRTEYETAQREFQRRSRELDAWERQLKEERDALRATFGKEKEELTKLKEDLARNESELAARRVVIEQTEEANLKKTAEIYGKMAPERAAQVLGQMYADGQQETVVKILYLMQDRSAAKTLEAITDPKVGGQITEKLKQVGRNLQQGG